VWKRVGEKESGREGERVGGGGEEEEAKRVSGSGSWSGIVNVKCSR
jgi:hypothetical protein